MIKKIISISLLLLLTFSFCFAIEVEQKLPGLSKDPSLAEYMGYIIDLIFKIGVFLAVLAFVIGAIKYATSMGSAEAMKEGKTRMISALLGVVLLLSSLMILKEINPEIEPKGLKPLETGSGAYFSNSINDVPAAPNGTIENITKSGYSKIKNICQDEKVDRPLVLKTWSSPKTALTWMNQTVQEIKCGGNVPIPQNQYEYELSTKDPGIYLISGGCDGPRSSRILVNTPALPEGYRNNLNGVIIINDVAPAGTDQSTNAYYGALFFQLNNYLGKCSTIYLAGENTDRINGKCSGMVADSFFNSFYFFEYNPTPATSGDGVVFYTEAFGGTKAKEAAASYSYLPKYR
ncbi:pilin, partial [Patescibacteria group bacterium]|nr:pilin [Patescibacteria group bacterium]